MDFLLQEVLHFWIAFRYSYILHSTGFLLCGTILVVKRGLHQDGAQWIALCSMHEAMLFST